MSLRPQPKPYLAVLLSALWCGLGNVYAGQFWTGLLLSLAYAISILGTVLFYGFLTTPLLWLFGLIWAWHGVRVARPKKAAVTNRKLTRLQQAWASPLTRIAVTVLLLLVSGLVIYDVPLLQSDITWKTGVASDISSPNIFPHAQYRTGLEDDAAGLTYFLLDLALQPVDDWRGYQTFDQFGQSALRYSLAFMAYALAQVHYLKLPAYPVPFQEAIDRLIQRMMQKRVWSYWYFENLWGNWKNNPDPVYEMNIMYSGHLANMIGLYEWLFDDHKYDEPGSIKLVWDEDSIFEYDHASLVERLYSQMHDNPYHSIACEPHQVFAMCNDHAALSLMLLDATHGTQFSEINREYLRNLDHLFRGTDGSFNYPYYYRLDVTLPLHLAVGDAWALALMHPFARERVRQMYPAFKKRHGRWNDDGTAKVTGAVIEFMDIGDYRFTNASQVSFGLVLASEVGDSVFAQGLWNYAVKKYQPKEQDGTKYFRKASLLLNSVFLLGQVNEADGLWQLYNHGWPASHFLEPRVEEVNLDKVLVVRADYSKETGLTIGLKPRKSMTTQAEVGIANLQPDMTYTLLREGKVTETFQTSTGSYSFIAKISKPTLFVVKPL